jgi:hypothetical protein
MTDHERREISAKLGELGFWGTDEPGDPAGDYHDAKTLHDRVDAKPAGDAFVVSTNASSHLSACRVLILNSELIFLLGAADNYSESICLATLAPPRFLESKKATTNKAASRAKGD